MPLIIIAGGPCSGKTTFAKLLETELRKSFVRSSTNCQVHVVNEESIGIKKSTGYINSQMEKSVRGSLKSAVDHLLSADNYVILDSLNYIKGFRYELYCSARTYRTAHCVVWVECRDEISNKWNEERISNGFDSYPENMLQDLRRRFEAPNESNRWDSPLFKVCMGDAAKDSDILQASPVVASSAPVVPKPSSFRRAPSKLPPTPSPSPAVPAIHSSSSNSNSSISAVSFSGTTPAARGAVDLAMAGFLSCERCLAAVCEHLLSSGAQAATPNSSTLHLPRGQADLLYELDRTSQQVVQAIAAQQALSAGPLRLEEFDRALSLHRVVGMAELQRHRQQFLRLNSQHPPPSSAAAGTLFIEFLASQI
mmetsp:Transcript_17144/g.24809  ORF Transcript_17144/g.24809 Transcript_17144/m.24809 type:complete len:366 (-) Transcript_17144:289-1386(-)